MRQLFAILFLLVACSFASDVRVPGGASYGYLGQGRTWASTINNDFILDMIGPGTGVCLAVINNDSGTHTATVNAYMTNELDTTTFGGNTGHWTQLSLTPSVTLGLTTYSFPASAITQLYVRAPGAAHVVISISGASGTGTADLPYSQTSTACGSGTSVSGNASTWFVNNPNAGAGNALTGSATVIAGVPGIRHVANCITTSLVSGATAGVTTFDVRDGGTAANCTTGTVIWSQTIGATATADATAGVSTCGLNLPSSPGNTLQLCSTLGIAAAIQSGSLSGFDTQ